ncbi:hypothetical protein AVEN_273304-1 [Araneus ventricosus]|uniref:Uncharacterized protein n=1 Tax=Araneus ventricosus TaxID=182803 RepID=A0A4Y2SS41_ARAVE|nr:hypothetical protein AVEN_273304-1 [Araneus ventricosus]
MTIDSFIDGGVEGLKAKHSMKIFSFVASVIERFIIRRIDDYDSFIPAKLKEWFVRDRSMLKFFAPRPYLQRIRGLAEKNEEFRTTLGSSPLTATFFEDGSEPDPTV